MDRAQTFDYGNLSNKALEFEAEAVQQQLETDGYYHDNDDGYHGNDGRWP